MTRQEIRRGNPAEEAADASLQRGEFEEAEASLRQALARYRLVGDTHREGRALLKMGMATMYERPAEALMLCGQAESLFDAKAEPILAWCSRHHRIWCLNDLGRPDEALALLDRSRALYRRYRRLDFVTRQLHWLEARIDIRSGRHQDAERRLRWLVIGLLKEIERPGELFDELVMLAVDLVRSMALQEGKTRLAIEAIDTFFPYFDSLRLHPLRLAAWFKLGQRLGDGLVLGWDDWDVIQDFFRSG
jgi:tetratricopeptide (TPR) repeat protein